MESISKQLNECNKAFIRQKEHIKHLKELVDIQKNLLNKCMEEKDRVSDYLRNLTLLKQQNLRVMEEYRKIKQKKKQTGK